MMQKSGKVVAVSLHYPLDPSTTAAIMAVMSERVAQEAEVLGLSGTEAPSRVRLRRLPAIGHRCIIWSSTL